MAAEVYYEDGVGSQNRGLHEEAILNFNKAIAADPKYHLAYAKKGESLQILERDLEALEAYNKILALKPDSYVAYNNKGEILRKLGRDEEAIENLIIAISLKPDYYEAYNNKAMSLDNLGRHEEALECYNKAIELHLDYDYAFNNKGYMLRNLGVNDGAVEQYKLAIAMKPDVALYHCNIAGPLLALGREEEAFEHLTKARTLLGASKQHLTKRRQHVSSKDVDFMQATLKKVFEMQGTVDDTSGTLGSLEANNRTIKSMKASFAEFQEHKRRVLASLDFQKGSDLTNLNGLNVGIKDYKKKAIEVEEKVRETNVELKKAKEELQSNLKTYNQKLEENLSQKGLSHENIERLKSYFHGFMDTFSSCYNTSRLVERGQVHLDGIDDVVDFLSTLGSFYPYVKDVMASGVTEIEDFLTSKEMIHTSRIMLHLASDSAHMNQLAGEIAYDILMHERVQDTILSMPENEGNQPFEERLKNLAKYCKRVGGDFNSFLYANKYHTLERRIGNSDASSLVEVWLEGNLIGVHARKLFVNMVVEAYSGAVVMATAVDQQDTTANNSPTKIVAPRASGEVAVYKKKSSCCNMF